MKLNFSSLFDLIFPITEDERILASCTSDLFLRKLQPTHTNSICALTAFRDPQVRSAIHLNKFHYHPKAQTLLSALLQEYLLQLPAASYIIIPIPLSAKREKERGYNQVTIVAKAAISTMKQMTLRTDILKRTRHTPPQTSLSKKERADNIKGAFAVAQAHPEKITGAHILLLDDVCTTGATLAQAKAALLPYHPASITCVAFAH